MCRLCFLTCAACCQSFCFFNVAHPTIVLKLDQTIVELCGLALVWKSDEHGDFFPYLFYASIRPNWCNFSVPTTRSSKQNFELTGAKFLGNVIYQCFSSKTNHAVLSSLIFLHSKSTSSSEQLPEGPHEEPGVDVILQEHSWCGS
jgi:hypothetical protein